MFKLLLIFTLALNTLLFSSNIVDIKISKIHGLVSFVYSLSDLKYSVKSYKKIYLQHYDAKSLDKPRLVVRKIYQAKIYNYKSETSLYHVIKEESVFVSSVSELEKNILKYKTSLTTDEIRSYFSYLKHFLPIYETLIYNDSLTKLQDVKSKIQTIMTNSNYDSLINQAASFYGVRAEDVPKIYLSLYPITQGNRTLAFMLGDVESIGVLVNRKKLNLFWLLSATIFHEIAHTLYKQNFDEIKQLLYRNKLAKYKDQKTFNESLATAFGAGWAFYRLTRLQSNGSWYNNNTYDKTAKYIYPMLSEYMIKRKKIDNNFVRKISNFLKYKQ